MSAKVYSKERVRAKANTYDDEEKLCNNGNLGSGNPKQLRGTAIFYLEFSAAVTEHKASGKERPNQNHRRRSRSVN